MSIFGYYENSDQAQPAFDPGLEVLCPYCLLKLERPMVTTSLMKFGDSRSYFYRAHKKCDVDASPIAVQEVESSLIDA